MVYISPEYEEHINELRDISILVEEYMSNQSYLLQINEINTITEVTILTDCYSIIIDELMDLGITFTSDLNSLLSDWYVAKRIYFLRKILDTEFILNLMRKSPSLIEEFSSIFEEDVDDTQISALLEYLNYEFVKDDVIMSEIAYAISEAYELNDRVINNILFKNHMMAIMELEQNKDPLAVISNMSLTLKLINKVKASREKIKKALSRCILFDLTLNLRYLTKAVDEYDKGKIEPRNINMFSYLLMTDEEELSDSLKKIKEEIVLKHKSNNKHHIEYYIANGITDLSKENIVELLLHIYDDSTTKEEFTKEVKEFILENDTFFPDNKKIYALALIPIIYKDEV